MNGQETFGTMNLSVLERHAIRKAVREAGFDILDDQSWAIFGKSSHATEKCIVWPAPNSGYLAGLTMGSVVQALEVDYGATIPALMLPSAPLLLAGGFLAPNIRALEVLLNRAWMLARSLPNALIVRFEQAVIAVDATERETTVRQRVGQSLFREGLMALWGGRCAITGLDVPDLLRASHAKPWAASNDLERLDVYNGLLLAAHWDAAFDAGLVTISHLGFVIPSPLLSDSAWAVMMISEKMRVHLQPQHAPYLAWHRDVVFRSE